MPRTIISIDQEEKTWLDREAKSQKVPMTEIVRRALRCYREHKETETRPDLAQLLKQTQGIWKAGDGLDYQRRLRGEWNDAQ